MKSDELSSPLIEPPLPLILLLSAIIGISSGLNFGEGSNLTVYILGGLRFFDPEFLANDWFISETGDVHKSFVFVVAALKSLDILYWGLAILKIASVCAFGWMLFVILNALIGRLSIWVWLPVMLIFFVINKTHSILGMYLTHGVVEPISLSAVFFMGAITAFILGRYTLSGLLLAVAGLFHTNLLLLGFPFFGLAYLVLGWHRQIARLVWQFAPALIVLAFEIPNIIYVMGLDLSAQERSEAARILIYFTIPYHLQPLLRMAPIVVLGGWILMGLVFLPELNAETDAKRRFGSLFISASALVAVALLLTTVVFIEPVSRLMVWRLAPFVEMFALIIVMTTAARRLTDPSFGNAGRYLYMAPAANLIALGIYAYLQYEVEPWLKLFVFHGALFAAIGIILFWTGKTHALHLFFMRWQKPALPLLVLLVVGIAAARATPSKFTLVCSSCGKQSERALFDWVHSTDRDSVFLIPISMDNFRMMGERAVVVDWKATPYRPNQMLEWFRRLEAVHGGEGSLKNLTRGQLTRTGKYNSMTKETLDSIVQRYGVDYAVFPRNSRGAKLSRDIVYENDDFVVFRPE